VEGYSGYSIKLEWSVNMDESENGWLVFKHNETRIIIGKLSIADGVVSVPEYQSSHKHRSVD
jgi:hypothetical protein